MKSANRTWDEATLDTYLTDPRKDIPAVKMILPGLPDDEARKNIIACLAALKSPHAASGGQGFPAASAVVQSPGQFRGAAPV